MKGKEQTSGLPLKLLHGPVPTHLSGHMSHYLSTQSFTSLKLNYLPSSKHVIHLIMSPCLILLLRGMRSHELSLALSKISLKMDFTSIELSQIFQSLAYAW